MFCAVVQDTNEKTGGVKLWRNLPYAEAIRRKEERREELFNRSMEGCALLGRVYSLLPNVV